MLSQIPTYLPTLLAAATFVCLLLAKRRVNTTTLIAAWWWSVVAVLVVCITETYVSWTAASGTQNEFANHIATLRYVAAVATFCPVVAVLGAKRPQHNAWQMIVFSLWCVLVLPAAESYFVRRGGAVQIHDARGVFLWLLIGVGLINYLPTRFALTAVLIATGQVCLLANHLPLVGRFAGKPFGTSGLSLIAVGAWVAYFMSRRRQRASADRPWLDFFNCFGAFWGFRVAERFNSLASAQNHKARLGWFGFESADPSVTTPSVESSSIDNLDSLLLRFVNPDWIRQRRAGEALDTPSESS